jgi:hypothetical protein
MMSGAVWTARSFLYVESVRSAASRQGIMKHGIRLAILLPLLLIVGACARSSQNTGGGPAAESSAESRRDPNQLAEGELANYATAFDAIRAMRSNWLRTRSASSFDTPGYVVVYRDGIKMGTSSVLSDFTTREIAMIRYFNPIEATQRWGIGHENGAIYVTSKVGTPPQR